MNQEKIYKTMENTGAMNIALGIVVVTMGVAAGVLMIVSGAKLLVRKKDVII